MLVRLELTDVHKFWPIFKKAMSKSREFGKSEKVLEALLDGRVQCWLIIDGKDLIGFVSTQVGFDSIEEKKVLTIRDYFSLNGVPEIVSDDMENTLTIYAKSKGCSSMIAYMDGAANNIFQDGYKTATVIIKEIN